MRSLHLIAVTLLLLLSTIGMASTSKARIAPKPIVSSEVKKMARKLAYAWVDTAGAHTLDSLANRSIAFAGMVPNLYVVLDGKRVSAGQALLDSGLIVIKSNVNEADAAAIRNSVYILMEIAEGRATRINGKG